MSRTVWAVQSNMKRGGDGSWSPKFDLSQASEYGKVEFIFGQGQVALMGPAMLQAIRQRLKDYEEGDYILTIGDPVLSFIVALEMCNAGFSQFRLLRWDNLTKRYTVVEYFIGDDNE